MVNGLDVFAEYFKGYTQSYVIIGGTACDYFLSKDDLEFRVTRDLDIVLLIEVLDKDFNDAIKKFITDGGYKNTSKASGNKQFYRFENPDDETFPYMIEIFSRKPDVIEIDEGPHCVPLDSIEEVNSLSAILLDDNYYRLIKENCVTENNVTFIKKEYIIPLKARAYIDNQRLKDESVFIKDKDISKHRNDIFRIAQTLTPEQRISLPDSVREDLRECLEMIQGVEFKMRSIGVREITKEALISNIVNIYSL